MVAAIVQGTATTYLDYMAKRAMEQWDPAALRFLGRISTVNFLCMFFLFAYVLLFYAPADLKEELRAIFLTSFLAGLVGNSVGAPIGASLAGAGLAEHVFETGIAVTLNASALTILVFIASTLAYLVKRFTSPARVRAVLM
jgi:uncharacterized membrane protein YhaH (DUF805 family)